MNTSLNGVNSRRERGFARKHTRGLSLLEVLIALVLLMAGMLALAGLQTVSLANNHSAYLRSQAVIQAHDMADRMYANSAGVQAGDYNSISGIPSNPPTCLTTATSTQILAGIACTPAQMAVFDGWEWNTANANVLPSGVGTVAGPDGNGVYTVTLSWLEHETDGTDTKTFAFQVKPMR
jgi:type IV pilus assembly protein PilV